MKADNNQFSISLPGEWVDRTVHLFMGPEDSGVQHNLNLVIDEQAGRVDLEEYARERIDLLRESLQGIEILKDEEKTLENGNRAYECVYRWIPVDGQVIFTRVVYMILDGKGYTFSANFSKKTIKTVGHEVNRIIESFRPGLPQEDDD